MTLPKKETAFLLPIKNISESKIKMQKSKCQCKIQKELNHFTFLSVILHFPPRLARRLARRREAGDFCILHYKHFKQSTLSSLNYIFNIIHSFSFEPLLRKLPCPFFYFFLIIFFFFQHKSAHAVCEDI